MPTNNNYPFRRLTDPFHIPATDKPSQYHIGPELMDLNGLTSFTMVNSWPIWIRLRGSGKINLATRRMTGSFEPVEEGKGWLIPPAPFFGTFTTQYPVWVSCLAVARPNFPIHKEGTTELLYPEADIELSYGGGA